MTLRPLLLALAVALLTLASSASLTACGSGGGGGTGGGSGGGGGASLSCTFSTAKSGGLCQVNFFCPDGGEPAVYCGEESDGGTDCACGPASASPPHFNAPGFCTDVVSNADTRAREANTKCNFGL